MEKRKNIDEIIKGLNSITSDELLQSLPDEDLKDLRDRLELAGASITTILRNRHRQLSHFRPKSNN